jgi:PilZ domain
MTERRAARRYDLSLPIIIRVPVEQQTAKNGRTRDISTRGVYFTLDHDVDAGTELDLTLTLPSDITRGTDVFVRAQGRVIRVDHHNDDGTKQVGVAAVIERYDIIRGEQTPS